MQKISFKLYLNIKNIIVYTHSPIVVEFWTKSLKLNKNYLLRLLIRFSAYILLKEIKLIYKCVRLHSVVAALRLTNPTRINGALQACHGRHL